MVYPLVPMLRDTEKYQMAKRPWGKEDDLQTMSPTEAPNVALARKVIGTIEVDDRQKKRATIGPVNLTGAEQTVARLRMMVVVLKDLVINASPKCFLPKRCLLLRHGPCHQVILHEVQKRIRHLHVIATGSNGKWLHIWLEAQVRLSNHSRNQVSLVVEAFVLASAIRNQLR